MQHFRQLRGTLSPTAVALGLIMVSATVAGAQQELGAISGSIRASGGDPIANANVQILGGAHRAISDQAGRFRLVNLAPASYRVVARYLGYRPDTVTVRVQAGHTEAVVISLDPAP